MSLSHPGYGLVSQRRSADVTLASDDTHVDETIARDGIHTDVALAKDDRMPSFLQTDSEKQGKVSQIPELVQYARDCPVHWTSKITTQNINVVLWSWAYVA